MTYISATEILDSGSSLRKSGYLPGATSGINNHIESYEELDRLLDVGGFLPTTTIDFPGRLSAVVFTNGCLWNCTYCHNKHLLGQNSYHYKWSEILAILKKRSLFLDGVVFSGGEPLLQDGLSIAIEQVKDMGYEIGIHTGGGLPERFGDILPLLDWVGFDIKAHKYDYHTITSQRGSGENAYQSLQILLDSGVDYEIRTTVDWRYITEEKLLGLAKKMSGMGVKKYVIQPVRLSSFASFDLCVPENVEKLYAEISELFDSFEVR